MLGRGGAAAGVLGSWMRMWSGWRTRKSFQALERLEAGTSTLPDAVDPCNGPATKSDHLQSNRNGADITNREGQATNLRLSLYMPMMQPHQIKNEGEATTDKHKHSIAPIHLNLL